MYKLIFTFLFIGCFGFIKAQPKIVKDTNYRAAYVYSENIVYLLMSPDGWEANTEVGLAQDIPIVMYPKGADFSSTPIVIFSNYYLLGKGRKYKDLNAILIADSLMHKSESPASIIKTIDTVYISKNQRTKAIIKYYKNSGVHNDVECKAYILINNRVVNITINTPSDKDYEANRYLFYDVVKSFVFIKNGVKLPKNK
jgi:hypothetical protein